MAFKPLPVLLFLTLLVQISSVHCDVSVVVGGRKATKVGTWTPIKDLKAKEVQDIAQFAVTEHNRRAKHGLVLKSVDKGETQVVDGTNYRLALTAKPKLDAHVGMGGRYRAVVWVKLNNKNLTAFDVVD